MLLEICASSLQSAINAQKGGAQRIELCSNLAQGGLTPSPATIELAKEKLDIPIFVLIRPRISGFHYTDLELEQMQRNILFCNEIGVDGVVFGVLNEKQAIDKKNNKILLEIAKPMQCTFHRAFDCLKNPLKSLEELIDLGFDRILSSGLQPTAIQGRALIKQLITQANNRIIVLPGSGLNSQNLEDFLYYTKTNEVHASAKKVLNTAEDHLFSADYFQTDIEEVQRLIAILQQFN